MGYFLDNENRGESAHIRGDLTQCLQTKIEHSNRLNANDIGEPKERERVPRLEFIAVVELDDHKREEYNDPSVPSDGRHGSFD